MRTRFRRVLVLLSSLATASFTLGAMAYAQSETEVDHWQLRCQERDNGLPCDLVQTIVDQDSGQRVLSFSIAYSPESGQHFLQIVVPLGIRLGPGVSLRIGDSFAAEHIPLTRCEVSGCIVEAIMAPDLLQALSSSDVAEGQVIVVDMTNQSASLPFSLKGFMEAANALKSQSEGWASASAQ